MLYILGVGCAHPETVIHNEDLLRIRSEDSSWLPKGTIKAGEKKAGEKKAGEKKAGEKKARRSSLPISFLEETGNSDPFITHTHAHTNSTNLGAEAAKDALKSANLSPENLGLIIGETSTPLETTPGESQRVTGALGLKGPAYELSASSCTLSLHVDTISKWKEEKIPDYVLSFSSNVTTQSINYRQGPEAYYFGDGASAVILSSRVPGKLKVVDSYFKTISAHPDFLTIDLYGYLSIGNTPSKELLQSEFRNMVERLSSRHALRFSDVNVILPPLFEEECKDVLSQAGVPTINYWTNAEVFGDTLGSYSACVLCEHWDEINKTSEVLIIQAGPGLGFGYLFLKS